MVAEKTITAPPATTSRQEFQTRVRAYRRAVLPFLFVYVLYIFSGPFFSWPLLLGSTFRWSRSWFDSQSFAIWFAFVVFMLVNCLPLFVLPCFRHHYDLYCPKCRYPDRYGRYIRRVLRDGRCPHCQLKVLE